MKCVLKTPPDRPAQMVLGTLAFLALALLIQYSSDIAWAQTSANAAPEFVHDAVYRRVLENSPSGTGVGGPVAATDADNDPLTYSISGADANLFDIHDASGQVAVGSGTVLDYETKSAYSLTVAATDPSGASAAIPVTIMVIDTVLGSAGDKYDFDRNERISGDEVIQAVRDYFNNLISSHEILEIVKLYFAPAVRSTGPIKLVLETDAELGGYRSDGTVDVQVTTMLRNDGDLRVEGLHSVAFMCRMADALVDRCHDPVTMDLPDGFGPVEATFTLRVPMASDPLAVSIRVDDGPSSTVEVDVPERVLGVGRHVWECYGDLPGRMKRCGGWHLDISPVRKWEPGKPISAWATGRQDYLAALDGILDQISDLLNHNFVMVDSREGAALVIQAGVSSQAVADACNGGTVGCGQSHGNDSDPYTVVSGEAHAADLGDNIPRWLISHELMHALIPQGHYSMPYIHIREIENLSAGNEAILRLHAHRLVRPGMTAEQLEKIIVFGDELLDASPLDVNTLAWRARETLLEKRTASSTSRGMCLIDVQSCLDHGVKEFGWTDYMIGALRLPGNHFQHLSLEDGNLGAYVAGKEFWIESADVWRSVNWNDFHAATGWRPNYTSLLTVLENILLLAHEGDIIATETTDGQVVLETRQHRELRLFSNFRMGLSLTLDSDTFHVSDYTVTICYPGESSDCIFEIQAKDGEYGIELTVPETIRQSTPAPTPWTGLKEFTSLSSGLHHTCALRNDGAPVCWGSDYYGQTAPPEGELLASISSAGEYTCGLRKEGSAVCWGSSAFLGEDSHYRGSRDGLWMSPGEPNQEYGYNAKPVGIMRFTTLSAGRSKACAIRPDGSLFCWGLGDEYAPSGDVFSYVSQGESHTCALHEDGSPTCWGNNLYGRAAAPTGERFVSISSGALHTCALRPDGTPVCWGSDYYGQSSPSEGERFVSISSGGKHACGLRHDGTAVCWGKSSDGQSSPPESERFVSISSGGRHTCALREDGTPKCWGLDKYGQSSPPEGDRFAVGGVEGDGYPRQYEGQAGSRQGPEHEHAANTGD